MSLQRTTKDKPATANNDKASHETTPLQGRARTARKAQVNNISRLCKHQNDSSLHHSRSMNAMMLEISDPEQTLLLKHLLRAASLAPSELRGIWNALTRRSLRQKGASSRSRLQLFRPELTKEPGETQPRPVHVRPLETHLRGRGSSAARRRRRARPDDVRRVLSNTTAVALRSRLRELLSSPRALSPEGAWGPVSAPRTPKWLELKWIRMCSRGAPVGLAWGSRGAPARHALNVIIVQPSYQPLKNSTD